MIMATIMIAAKTADIILVVFLFIFYLRLVYSTNLKNC